MSAVSFHKVVVENEQGRRVLDGVSFTVDEGTSLALVGHNGGGKTTALRLAAALGSPTSGVVRVFGEDIATLPYAVRRRLHLTVGFVFEAGGLWANRTIRENIELPLAYHDVEDVQGVAADLATELGIEAHLDTPSFLVNASVRKRALFARALSLSPRMLLCDEPAVGLVHREAKRVSDALEKRLRKGMTMLVADHDGILDPFRVDNSLYLENGRLLARPSALPPPDRDEGATVFGASLLGGVA